LRASTGHVDASGSCSGDCNSWLSLDIAALDVMPTKASGGGNMWVGASSAIAEVASIDVIAVEEAEIRVRRRCPGNLTKAVNSTLVGAAVALKAKVKMWAGTNMSTMQCMSRDEALWMRADKVLVFRR
jgi:hypothetical protein